MLEETDRKCDWVGTRWCMVEEILTGYTSRSIIDNDKDYFSPVFEECFNIFANTKISVNIRMPALIIKTYLIF